MFQKNVAHSVESMVLQTCYAKDVFVNTDGLERDAVCMSEL